MKYTVIFYTEIEGSFDKYIARDLIKSFDDLSEAKAYAFQHVPHLAEYLGNVCFCINESREV